MLACLWLQANGFVLTTLVTPSKRHRIGGFAGKERTFLLERKRHLHGLYLTKLKNQSEFQPAKMENTQR